MPESVQPTEPGRVTDSAAWTPAIPGHEGERVRLSDLDLLTEQVSAARERYAMDADLTLYWPAVRPCWEAKS